MTNAIPQAALGQILGALIDYRGKTPTKSKSGVKLITAKVIKGGRIEDGNHEFIAEADYDAWMRRGLPQQWDILITTEAPLGEVAILRTLEKVALAQRVILLRADKKFADQNYLFQALKSPLVQSRLYARGTGTTVLGIKQSELVRVEIPLPKLATQRRIASILSAYDDLIENNTRRIAILEEMARRLSEEWFVRFRFPGHEGVRMVESEMGLIPEGWRVDPLEKVCPSKDGIQTGPFGSQLHKSDYSSEGVPVLMPKDLLGFRINTETIARIPEATAQSLPRHRMKPGDIVYGRRGDIGRRAFIMAHQSGWFCGTGCLRIRPDPAAINGWYLFNYFGQDNVVGLIAGRAHGVTMPNLNTRLLASVPVVRPPRSLQDQFEQVTFPTASLRETLIAKNINLRTTRDLLLPKLISGELDVSTLPGPQAQTI